MIEGTTEHPEALADELRKVTTQIEALLEAIERRAAAIAQRASVTTQAYVRENPWTIAGGALATGLVLGATFIGCLRSGDRAVS
jgi:ElaB/YqjD/DUF883 family membrane-anchored ribosome-binding protein